MLESKNYIYRVSLLQGSILLKEVMTKTDINKMSALYFESLLDDPVPNVTINLIKYFREYRESLDSKNLNHFLAEIQKKTDDTDSDISYYSNLVI
mmetsp:Transcript_7267/g.986  ORF Transcript_7267/g.986 Transcript_7267/m.986 type:complete len:95 (+) Transcript_7267:40-324(+)